jgi:hypothetical protein
MKGDNRANNNNSVVKSVRWKLWYLTVQALTCWEMFCFYWTRRFIIVFRKAHHCTLSWTSWIQSTFSYIHLRSISVLSFCLRTKPSMWHVPFRIADRNVVMCPFLLGLSGLSKVSWFSSSEDTDAKFLALYKGHYIWQSSILVISSRVVHTRTSQRSIAVTVKRN